MTTLENALLPLGAFWVTFKTLLDAAGYLNGLREAVISGYHDGRELSAAHRKALAFDWRVTTCASIIVSIVFSGINFWIGHYLAAKCESDVATLMTIIGACTLLGTISLVAVAVSDARAMRVILEQPLSAKSDSSDTQEPNPYVGCQAWLRVW